MLETNKQKLPRQEFNAVNWSGNSQTDAAKHLVANYYYNKKYAKLSSNNQTIKTNKARGHRFKCKMHS